MKKTILIALTFVTIGFQAHAEILMTQANGKNISGVTVSAGGTLAADASNIPVQLLGAGVRQHKVALWEKDIYILELFASDVTKFDRTNPGDANNLSALNSLDTIPTLVLRLNFVYSVDGPTVQASFSEALAANQVDVTDPAVAQFLAAVKNGGVGTSGKSFVIACQKNQDGSETVYYQNTLGVVAKVSGNSGFSKKILSIWLGASADKELANLKVKLIQGL